jgi:hypothetical protein
MRHFDAEALSVQRVRQVTHFQRAARKPVQQQHDIVACSEIHGLGLRHAWFVPTDLASVGTGSVSDRP